MPLHHTKEMTMLERPEKLVLVKNAAKEFAWMSW